MSKIFVSYTSADRLVVEPIVNELKRHFFVWFDQTGIEPGTPDWLASIDAAIQSASAVIVMLSPAAVQSQWVEYEYKAALSKGKPIFPYIIAPVTLPASLTSVQALNHSRDGDWEKLIKELPVSSRIWGDALISPANVLSGKTFGELAQAYPQDILHPQMTKAAIKFDLVGLPIKQSLFCKTYLIGRESDIPSPTDVIQVGLQLTTRDFSLQRNPTGDYPQDDFPASIATHFLQTPRDSIRLFLVRGPLEFPYDAKSTKFGLSPLRPTEWEDAVEALKGAQNFYPGRAKIQLFVNGPAILTYKLGAENATLRRYELYQLNYQTGAYHSILTG